MSVSVIKPIEVTEAVYSASGIAEPDVSRGEVEWESFEDRYESAVVSDAGALFAFDIARTNHGELLAAYAAVNNVGIAKFDINNNLVWSQLLGGETTDPISQLEFMGISVVDDDVVIHWHNNSTGQGNSGKCYRHSFSGFAATGAIPPIVSSMNEMPNFPQSIKESENKRLVEIDDVLFAASNDGYSASTSVTISTLDSTTGEQSNSNTESLGTGRVEGICPNGSGGVFVCARNSIMIEYNAQLEKIRFKTDIPVAGGFSQLGFYDGIITTAARFTTAGDELMLVDVGSDLNLTTSYKKDDEVITTSNHRKYRCLVEATFSDPRETATGDATAEWIDIGPTNKWAMFDDSISTKSVMSSQFSFDLSAETKFDGIAFFGCEGIQYITVTIKNTGGTFIEAKTADMIDSDAALEWGLDDNSPAFISDALINDLTYGDGYYATVTITPYAGFDAKVQLVSFGLERFLGKVISESTRQNYQDLSEYKFDEFGESVIVKRPVIKMDTYSILTDGARVGVVDRFIKSIAGQFNVWYANIGNGQYMLTYGSYERSPTNVTANNHRNYVVTVRSAV